MLLLGAALLPRVAQAQTAGDDAPPAPTTDLLNAGPDGGLIIDLTVDHTAVPPRLLALTDAGLYAFDRDADAWTRAELRPPEDPTLPQRPWRTGIDHLVGVTGLHSPLEILLLADARQTVLLNERDQLWRAEDPDGALTLTSPPEAPNVLTTEATLLPNAPGELLLLRVEATDAAPTRDQPRRTRLLRRDVRGAWTSTEHEGGAALLRTAPQAGAPVTWRNRQTPPPRYDGATAYFVDTFLRADDPKASPIDWRATLRRLPGATREACRGATSLLEIAPDGGAKPTLLAIGPRTLCRSINKGVTFTPAASFLDGAPPLPDPPGDLAAAIAFPWADAESGVRLLITTQPRYAPLAVPGRVNAGRLFLSDDLGRTWSDATPDIEGPGALLDLEAVLTPDGPLEVWLLTARRGLYRSTQAGRGFVLHSPGIHAMPVHALAQDPRYPDILWAASPTGLYRYSGLWTRESPAPIRAVASRPSPWQLWIGTWHGQLIRRTPEGPLKVEPLDFPNDVPRLPTRLRLLEAAYPPRVDPATGARPVSIVLPAGVAQGGEVGFAFVEPDGLWRRSPSGEWTHLTDPFPPEIPSVDLLAMLPLLDPTAEELPGLLLLTQRHDGTRYRIEAWRWQLSTGWSTLNLPPDLLPSAAIELQGALWIANATGGLHTAVIRDDTLELRRTDYPTLVCTALARTPDGGVACAAAPPAGSSTDLAIVARANNTPADGLQPTPLTAPNPSGRPLPAPTTLAASRNSVGDHLWLSNGLSVYAPPRALTPLLPIEPSEPWFKSIPWNAVAIGVGVLLLLIGLLYLLRQTRRFFKPWFDTDL